MAKTDFTFVGTPHDPYSISGSDPYSSTGNARLAAWYNCDRGNIDTGGPSSPAQTNNDRGERITRLKDLSGNSKTPDSYRHLKRWDIMKPIVTGSEVALANDPQLTNGDDLRYIMGSQNQHGQWHMALSNLPFETDAGSLTLTATEVKQYGNWVSASKDTSGEFLHDRYNLLQSDRGGNGYTLFATGKQNAQQHSMNEWEYASLNLLSYPYALQRGNQGNYLRQAGTFQMFAEPNSNWDGGYGEHAFGVMWETRYSDANTDMHENDVTGENADNQRATADNAFTYIRSPKTYALQQFHPVACRYDSTGLHTEGTGSFNMEMFVNGHKVINESGSWNSNRAPRMVSDAVGISIGCPGNTGDTLGMAGYYSLTDDMDDPNVAHGWLEGCAYDDALSNIRMQQIQKYFSERVASTMSGSDGESGLEYLSMFQGGGQGHPIGRTSLTASALSNANGGDYHRSFHQFQTSSATPLIQYETAGGAFVKSTKSSSEFYRVPSTKAISLRAWARLSGHQHDANNDGVQFALVGKATSQWGHQVDNIKGYAFKFGTFENGAKEAGAPKFRLSLRNSDRWDDGEAGTNNIYGDTEVTNASITPKVDEWFKMRLDIIPSAHAFDLIKCYVLDTDGTTWRQMGSTITVDSEDVRYRYWTDNTEELRKVDAPNGIHNGYWISMKSTNGKQLNHTKVFVEGFQILTDTV